jgi:sensor domain CHASE-containing protein
MNWFRKSLFRRLLVSYFIPVIIGFVGMGIVISNAMTDYFTRKAEQEMLHQAKTVNRAIQQNYSNLEELKKNLGFYGDAFNKQILVFDANGNIVATSTKDEVHAGNDVDGDILNKIFPTY